MSFEINLDFLPEDSYDLQQSIQSWLTNECATGTKQTELDEYFDQLMQDPSYRNFLTQPFNQQVAQPPPATTPVSAEEEAHTEANSAALDASVDKICKLQLEYCEKHNQVIYEVKNLAKRVDQTPMGFHMLTKEIYLAKENNSSLLNTRVGDYCSQALKRLKGEFLARLRAIVSECINQNVDLGDPRSRRFSKGVLRILETSFSHNQYPTEEEKERIGQACQLHPRQVNNWFTNKRNRSKQLFLSKARQ